MQISTSVLSYGRYTFSEFLDVELDDEVAVLLVEFEPIFDLLLFLSFLWRKFKLLAEPLSDFLPLNIIQGVEVKPRRENFAVGWSGKRERGCIFLIR